MNQIKKELINFFFTIFKEPDLALKTFAFFLDKLGAKKIYNLSKKRDIYPDEVKKYYYNTILESKPFLSYSIRKLNLQMFEYDFIVTDCIHSNQATITLAGKDIEYNDIPDWHQRLNDIEQTTALHRWNWLLFKLTECHDFIPYTNGEKIITDWIIKMDSDKICRAFETYTAAERICNFILFFYKTGRNAAPSDLIIANLIDTTYYVSDNLEYFSEDRINNHILNNARSLFFSGVFFNQSSFIDFAGKIIKNASETLITKEGFLREGSTHYHFLVTRWFLELYVFSVKAEIMNFMEYFKSLLKKMLPACWFFLVYNRIENDWRIPLIGDVSPDSPPSWLISLPWSKPALDIYSLHRIPVKPKNSGWSALFEPAFVNVKDTANSEVFGNESFKHFHESGWYRLDLHSLTVFWHVEQKGIPLFPSHGHCDTGSFVLFFDGEYLFTDPGRYNYYEDKVGFYGVTGQAHNQVIIDGLDPFLYYKNDRYPFFYKESEVTCFHEWRGMDFFFKITHSGFTRISGDKIKFERSFHIRNSRLVIKDRINGNKKHKVTTYFHLPPGLKAENTDMERAFKIIGIKGVTSMEFNMKSSSHNSTGVLYNESIDIMNDFFFPAYGKKVNAKTLRFEMVVQLPISNSYTLEWE